MADILSTVNGPQDIKKLNTEELNKLSAEIREFLIDNVLKTGGHLASNLGVVELTLSIHKVFSAPTDDIIWDVGHQSYVHKIICGRKDKFSTLRKLGGISGFPKPDESEYDTFETGHSGTSLSVALGFACSADLNHEKKEVVAVIGDASFSGGLPMEALNCISQLKKKVIIILNDNQMSIERNNGALAQHMNKIRTNPLYYSAKKNTKKILDKIPIVGSGLKRVIIKIKNGMRVLFSSGVVFEQFGYKYLGPIDGHNIELLCSTLNEARESEKSVVVHVCTTKGKGYVPAEGAPEMFHGVSPKVSTKGNTYTKQFGITMCRLAETNKKLVSVCPSMVVSCGLKAFGEQYKDRIYDVGIAEEHAVTFAAGLAQKGFIPIVSVYSTFLQRAYDSIVHDVALGDRHVVFAIDRAGIVGDDGKTHQGIYDISYLSHIPNMSVLAPCDNYMLDKMLQYAVSEHNGPIAIRYPKGCSPSISKKDFTFGKADIIKTGRNVTIAALGRMVECGLECAELLKQEGIEAEVIDLRCASPIDFETVFESATRTGLLITVEDNIFSGGVGEKISAESFRQKRKFKVINKAFPDMFISEGTPEQLFDIYGLSAQKLAQEIKNNI